jgi:hypothetical protein
MKRIVVGVIACLACATLLRADDPPPVPGMERLDDNGRSFQTPRKRLPLRVYDSPGLLGLPADEQGMVLDRAMTAGFNAVSFEAPLVGPQGLSRPLGKLDPGAVAAWTRVFEACEMRRLYALPVLWTPATVDALIGTATARAHFFAGRNALGWQAWGLRQAAAIPVRGRPLSATAAVAGWVLYRGPWPDGAPVPGRAQPSTPTAEARLTGWARWQVQAARRSGFSQRLGLGLWPKQDLGLMAAAVAEPIGADGPAPTARLASADLVYDASPEHERALDVLPPVPGVDAVYVGDLDDSATVQAAPTSPWDLEGLDWAGVEGLFSRLPLSSQVDFLELTLDTEDWYRVGERLAEAAQAAEVPLLWRQDWRTASRYERNKRLAPPPPLAGLIGGWPDDDWPPQGETLWPLNEAPSPQNSPFRFSSAKLSTVNGEVVFNLTLNRPAAVSVDYGVGLPLDKQVASPTKDRPKAEHRFVLRGVGPGKPFLLKVQALSPQHGTALMRTRWAQAPK